MRRAAAGRDLPGPAVTLTDVDREALHDWLDCRDLDRTPTAQDELLGDRRPAPDPGETGDLPG